MACILCREINAKNSSINPNKDENFRCSCGSKYFFDNNTRKWEKEVIIQSVDKKINTWTVR
jgi:hypothetical protein